MEGIQANSRFQPKAIILLFLVGCIAAFASSADAVKREGKLPRKVKASAEKVWPIASDFAHLQRVYEGLDECKIVVGVPNQVGCVRLVARNGSWSLEKLETLDNKTMTYSYTTASGKNNLGFQDYVDVVTVRKVDENACTVTWDYKFLAANDTVADALVQYLSTKSTDMASKMEELANQ